MSRPDPLLRYFARATAARPGPVARIRGRLMSGFPRDAELRGVLDALPSPGAAGVRRVQARLRTRRPTRSLAPLWLGAAVLAALVLVATWGRPAAPEVLTAELTSETTWSDLAPIDGIQLAYRGAGDLRGTSLAPVVDWEVGTVHVEVEPDRSLQFEVHTREAQVRVVGTGFDVTRDALGTTVHVRHGNVAVLCASGEKALLGATETRLCAPTGPAGLLGRARALVEAHADDTAVLATAEAGLAAGAAGPTRGELSLVRIEALTRLDRSADALSAAEAALAESPLRARDLRRLAARNALHALGCAAALPHLAALVQDEASGPELVQYADCVGPTDPAAARAALTAALRAGAPPEREAAIVERLTRLPAPADAP